MLNVLYLAIMVLLLINAVFSMLLNHNPILLILGGMTISASLFGILYTLFF
jgi:hypothetical protein